VRVGGVGESNGPPPPRGAASPSPPALSPGGSTAGGSRDRERKDDLHTYAREELFNSTFLAEALQGLKNSAHPSMGGELLIQLSLFADDQISPTQRDRETQGRGFRWTPTAPPPASAPPGAREPPGRPRRAWGQTIA